MRCKGEQERLALNKQIRTFRSRNVVSLAGKTERGGERDGKAGKVSVCRESKASHENYNGKKLKGCHEKLMMQETSGKI